MPLDDLETDVRFTGSLGMWETDLRTGIVQWSPHIDDILGYPTGGSVPPGVDRLLAAIVPEERWEVEEALQRSIERRVDHYHVECRCRRPDGREVLVRHEWSVVCDDAGQPSVLRGVIQDVTHRRKARAALRRRTATLELLYAVAACANEAESLKQALQTSLERICTFGGWPVGSVYLVSDTDPRELTPADAWYSTDKRRFAALREAVWVTRYTAGMGAPGVVLRSGRPEWSADIRKQPSLPSTLAAIAAGLRTSLDVPVRVGVETTAVLEFFSEEQHAPDEEMMQAMQHVAAQLGRVFERQRAEDALRAGEARLRQILESMPIGVFVMDAERKPYFINKYARSFAWVDDGSAPLAGPQHVYLAGTDQPYPEEKNPLLRALARESSVVADLEIRPSVEGARRIPLEVWGSPVFDERGRVAYALSAFHDISERRKVERLKDEFVSVVSHELRTPLTSIQGAIGLLENGVVGDLAGEALEMAHIAGDSCRRLLRLVNELLDIQKLEVGTPTLHPRPLALGPILEQVVAASRPYAAALEIRLDLLDEAPGVVVCADSDRLAQVVANFLSNAIKYTPPGERVVVAAARLPSVALRGAPRIRVAVEDCGPGVPDEFRGSLFQKFSQADASDARQKAGTGLGLAICKVIVEKLGGTIGHEPVVSGGARFYFELPELRANDA